MKPDEASWDQNLGQSSGVYEMHRAWWGQMEQLAMIKTQEDFCIKIFTSHFIARVRKGLLKVCMWEGAGDRT